MRPPATPQSALRAPLNRVLGTEANVRILRELTRAEAPLSPSELAAATQLGLAGITKAVTGLIASGIVERVGTSTRSPVRVRRDHPLITAIRELFRREREQFERLIQGLRAAAAKLDPPPRAVWAQGPVAKGIDRPGDTVTVGILTSAANVDRARAALEDEIVALDREFGITLEVRALSAADLEAALPEEIAELRGVIVLLGPEPTALVSPPAGRTAGRTARTRSHADADARARAFAVAIADRLTTEPRLVPRARAFIASRLTKAAPGEQRELREWDRILRTMSTTRLRRFLVDPGERATRLRQTLPFVGALTADERERIARERPARRHTGSSDS
jgi:DNA-binding MarR family transcriptional regulator